MTTVFTVTATLPYALRHPDCTDTSQETLMRMAADHIEQLEKTKHELGEKLDGKRKLLNGIMWRVCESEVLRDPNLSPAARAILAEIADMDAE